MPHPVLPAAAPTGVAPVAPLVEVVASSSSTSLAANGKHIPGQQLLSASQKADIPMLHHLLQNGPPGLVHFRDDEGHTALHAACGCFEDTKLNAEVWEVVLGAGHGRCH